ncbi:MAG: peptidylprolyl isomerase [Candidatus Edwardsbacteria bacterium]
MRYKKILFVFFISLTQLSLADSSTAQGSEIIEGIVAKVGQEIILKSELEREVGLYQLQMGQQIKDTIQLKKDVLEQMIEAKILLQEAKKDTTIQVKSEEIEKALNEAISDMKAKFPSEEDFQRELVKEGTTVEALKAKYREETRERLLVTRFLEKKIKPEVSIDPKEVEDFYKQNKDSLPTQPERVELAHILVAVKPGQEVVARALQKTQEVYAKLKAGGDFALLAKKYSADSISASRGGALGFVKKGETVPEFEEVVFKLRKGELSQIFESRFGLHIVKCLDNKGDSVNIRHILIQAIPAKADESRAKRIADGLYRRIQSGEDFAKVAKGYSDDLETKEKGGDLGLIPLEALPSVFKDEVAVMRVGEVSEPAKSEYGYHLLKLLKREEPQVPTFEEAKTQLTEYLRRRKMQEKYEYLIEELKKKYYIEKANYQ